MSSLFALLYEISFFGYAFFKSLTTATGSSVFGNTSSYSVPCVWVDHFNEIYRSSKEERARIRAKLNVSQQRTFDKIENLAKQQHQKLTAKHNQAYQQPLAREVITPPTEAEMQDLAEGLMEATLPPVIAKASQSTGNTFIKRWTDWTYIGYLDGSHFPEAHPNFQICFKPGNYVAKYKHAPDKNGQQWMLSLNTSLDGTQGDFEAGYPHYSIYFNDNNTVISGEHFTFARSAKVDIDKELGGAHKAFENFKKQVRSKILKDYPEIEPKVEPYL